MAMAARQPARIELPSGQGPWSWRVFGDRDEAWRFFYRLQEGDPPPRLLHAPHIAPDDTFVPAGTWLVLYRPIIATQGRRFGHTASYTPPPCPSTPSATSSRRSIPTPSSIPTR